MHVVPRASKLRCALCHEVVGRFVVRCACGSLVHPLCSREFGRCPTLACGRAIRHARVLRLHPMRHVLGARFMERVAVTLASWFIVACSACALHARADRIVIERPVFEPGGDACIPPSQLAPNVDDTFVAPPDVASAPFPDPPRRIEPGELAHPASRIEDLEIILSARIEARRYRPDEQELRFRVRLRNRGSTPLVVACPWTVADFTWEVDGVTARMRRGYRMCGSSRWLVSGGHFLVLEEGEERELDEWFESPLERESKPGVHQVSLRYEVDVARARVTTALVAPHTVSREDGTVFPEAVALIHRLSLGRATSNVLRVVVPESLPKGR